MIYRSGMLEQKDIHKMVNSPLKVLSIKKKINSLASSIGEKMNIDWYDTLCWIYIDHLNFFLIIWVEGRSSPWIPVENCVFRAKKGSFQILMNIVDIIWDGVRFLKFSWLFFMDFCSLFFTDLNWTSFRPTTDWSPAKQGLFSEI